MDYLDFISSGAVRKHMSSTGYKPTATEYACIVWYSNRSIKERHAAWRYIIDNYKDEPLMMTERKGVPYYWGLKEFLSDYMKMENELHSIIVTGTERGVFSYMDYDHETLGAGTLEELLRMRKETTPMDHSSVDKLCNFSDFGGVISYIRFNLINENNDIKIVEVKGSETERCNMFNEIFRTIKVCFPDPFKKGDIVWGIRWINDTPALYIGSRRLMRYDYGSPDIHTITSPYGLMDFDLTDEFIDKNGLLREFSPEYYWLCDMRRLTDCDEEKIDLFIRLASYYGKEMSDHVRFFTENYFSRYRDSHFIEDIK